MPLRLVIFLTLFGVSFPSSGLAASTQDDLIRKAVLLHLANLESKDLDLATFCVGFHDGTEEEPSDITFRDPAPSFFKILHHSRYVFRPISACDFKNAIDKGVRERTTQARAARLSVGAIRILSTSKAGVAAGYYFNGLAAGGYTCLLSKKKELWVVDSCKMHWIA